MSLDSLIASAYRIKRDQIAGPDWLSSQRFEIHATIPEGTSQDQVPEMIQTLLEERFKLKAHIENKEQPVYALVVSKEGSKLMNADDVSDAGATPIGGGPMSIKREGDSFMIFDPRTGMVMRGGKGGRGSGTMRTEILKTSMPAFAEYITPFVDHPVVDATGLKGSYKMTMELPIRRTASSRGSSKKFTVTGWFASCGGILECIPVALSQTCKKRFSGMFFASTETLCSE